MKKIKKIFIQAFEKPTGAIILIACMMIVPMIVIKFMLQNKVTTYILLFTILIGITIGICKNIGKIKSLIKFYSKKENRTNIFTFYYYVIREKYLITIVTLIFIAVVSRCLFGRSDLDAASVKLFESILKYIIIVSQIIVGLIFFGSSYKGFYNTGSKLVLGKVEFSDDEKEYFEAVLYECIEKYGVLKIEENALLIDALIRWGYGCEDDFKKYKTKESKIAKEKFYKITPLQLKRYTSYILSGNEKYKSEVEYLLKQEPIYKFLIKKDENGKYTYEN